MEVFKIEKEHENKYVIFAKSEYITIKLFSSKVELETIHKMIEDELVSKDINSHIDFLIQVSLEEVKKLGEISDADMQALLREISSENLTLTLKFSRHLKNTAFENKVIANMSKRAAEMLIDDLDTKRSRTIEDCRDALREIYTIAVRMSQCNEIVLDTDPRLLID